MLPKKIGDFELQTHVLSLDEEKNRIHIQYRDKKFRTYTALSTTQGITIQYSDPEKKKILWIDSEESLAKAVDLLKIHCTNFSQEALYRNLYSIKERHEQDKFKGFMTNVIQDTVKEGLNGISYDELWQLMSILKKDYRLYDFIEEKEGGVAVKK